MLQRSIPLAGVLGLALIACESRLTAANDNWVGLSNGNWQLATNWSPVGIPAANQTTTFDPTLANGQLVIDLGGPASSQGLIFSANGSSGFTFNNGTLLLGKNGIVNNNTATQLLNNSLTLTQNQTWNAASGAINVTGGVDMTSGNLAVNGAAGTTISGNITGASTLTVGGAATLSGDNSGYTGAISINSGGNLTLVSSNSIGGVGATMTIKSGGTLTLAGGVTTIDENKAINVSGTGSGGGGAIVSTGTGGNTLNGNITVAANSSFESDSGLFTIGRTTATNTLSLGSKILTLQGAGDFQVNSTITGSGGLTITGTGTTTLAGPAANTYSGATTVNGGGTLELNKPAGVNAIGGGTVTLTGGSTLLFGADNQLPSNVAIKSGGSSHIVVGATTQVAGTLTLTGNSYIDFSSTVGATGSISFATSTASGWSGTLYVNNWQNGDSLQFGTSSSGLGSGGPIFTNIIFVNPNGAIGNAFGSIDASGFIRPVPEVGGYLWSGALAGLVGFGQVRAYRRRRLHWQQGTLRGRI